MKFRSSGLLCDVDRCRFRFRRIKRSFVLRSSQKKCIAVDSAARTAVALPTCRPPAGPQWRSAAGSSRKVSKYRAPFAFTVWHPNGMSVNIRMGFHQLALNVQWTGTDRRVALLVCYNDLLLLKKAKFRSPLLRDTAITAR
jgi:hypothetical protein